MNGIPFYLFVFGMILVRQALGFLLCCFPAGSCLPLHSRNFYCFGLASIASVSSSERGV